MQTAKTLIFIFMVFFLASAQVSVGGFSSIGAFVENTPDIIDSTFILSVIAKSTDINDPDFRLEHHNERGRMRLFRGDIFAFTDGTHFYIADGTHGLGSPRFRRLTRCEDFSYFRRVQKMPAGTERHSENNTSEVWVIVEHSNGEFASLTDRATRAFLIRRNPMLYHEFSDRNRRDGSIIDYVRRVCNNN
ncbi:MAG: hypothetical protein FWE23_04020 [Chitinivibrionia bacterium]|jgi:hypothetical protein|nr:hypothetical protein [Chitinivibrionia bacterium]